MFKSFEKILVIGQSGCGKSYLAKRVQDAWPRRVIIDSLGEYDDLEGADFAHNFQEFTNFLEKYKLENRKNFVLVFTFDPESEISSDEFNHILRVCYYFGNIQVVIEEVQFYSSVHMLPHWLKTSILTGRHKNMSLLFTSQRPGEINKTIFSQCNHIFVGKIVEGNDLKYISNFLRQDTDKLVNLPIRRFLYFNGTTVTEISNDI